MSDTPSLFQRLDYLWQFPFCDDRDKKLKDCRDDAADLESQLAEAQAKLGRMRTVV
jgi:hypothetical protein